MLLTASGLTLCHMAWQVGTNMLVGHAAYSFWVMTLCHMAWQVGTNILVGHAAYSFWVMTLCHTVGEYQHFGQYVMKHCV